MPIFFYARKMHEAHLVNGTENWDNNCFRDKSNTDKTILASNKGLCSWSQEALWMTEQSNMFLLHA